MKVTGAAVFALLVTRGHGFVVPNASKQHASQWSLRQRGISASERVLHRLRSSLSDEEKAQAERMKAILEEESKNPANMAETAERMKDMTPDNVDQVIKEMEQMGPIQKAQLKAMGMDPELMKQSMQMMRDNPSMMESARKMMEGMTPDQLMAQSRLAQEQMASMSPEQIKQASKAMEDLSPDQLDAAAEIIKEKGLPGSATDPMVIDTMFRTAEIMSSPPSGGVTLAAFATLPPISVLSGDREEDLSPRELAECWADGSLGATRIDRAGFERVWTEVREYFEGDIMDEARKTAAAKKKKVRSGVTPAAVDVVTPSAPSATSPVSSGAGKRPIVGENLTSDQMKAVNEQVKKMSDDDMNAMLDSMSSMSPEQEARMKDMGVDPTMMKKAADMMEKNPMMRKAAQAMMKNMSPEQMMRMSQQAQKQMANMSPEDLQKEMDRVNKDQN